MHQEDKKLNSNNTESDHLRICFRVCKDAAAEPLLINDLILKQSTQMQDHM